MKMLKFVQVPLLLALVLSMTSVGSGQRKPTDAPVDYTTVVENIGAVGAASAYVDVHIERFTTDAERTTLLDALRRNGYQSFLPAFRRSPVVGVLKIKEQKWDLRLAQTVPNGSGQIVTVATDKPVFFVGGGLPDAKPRAGFEVSVMRLEVDSIGTGKGSFWAAARVKPNGDSTGVEVSDYAGEPVSVTRATRRY